jgi:D-sedoheptulose 7-phosphate isomerase
MDSSTLSACGNDYSFEKVFSRPFEALANRNDILIAISTSGNSKNIIDVLKKAKKNKIFSIGLLGSRGGVAKKYCNLSLIVQSNTVARIQESHIFLGHYILESVENLLLKKK